MFPTEKQQLLAIDVYHASEDGCFRRCGAVPAEFYATYWSRPKGNLTPKQSLQSSNTESIPSSSSQKLSQSVRKYPSASHRSLQVDELATARHPKSQSRSHEVATAPAPPVTALGVGTATTTTDNSPQSQIQRPQPEYRRSFLETFLARQQNRDTTQRRQLDSSRVLNPINHLPRPTPIRIPPPPDKPVKNEEDQDIEGKSLLTLPEQRRSYQNSPHTPTVEQSPRLDPGSARSRSSIGLPSNQQRTSYPPSMPGQDPVRGDDGNTRVQQKKYSRRTTSKQYENSHDIESQEPNSPAAPFPGATYGLNPDDQPTKPARRVSSVASLRKRRSVSSLHTDPNAPPADSNAQDPDGNPDESIAEELAWNSSHPCFPHPNPHVPLSSPLYEATKVIRIRRDWMAHGDLAPAYSNIYPEILDPLLPESEFRFLINHVNRTLLEAFDPFTAWNWIDGLLGLATGWLWEDFRPGGMKSKLKGLEFWIEQWNHRVGSRDGVRVISLRRTGYMSLDIEIPDPQVQVVNPDEDDDQQLPEPEVHGHMRVGDLRRGTVTTDTETDSRL